MPMSEEPLEDWARRRDRRRNRAINQLRAVPLCCPTAHASHVHPGAPRAIEQFDGYQWIVITTVTNLQSARQYLRDASTPHPRPAPPVVLSIPRLEPAARQQRVKDLVRRDGTARSNKGMLS
jgi:hypothetical protein